MDHDGQSQALLAGGKGDAAAGNGIARKIGSIHTGPCRQDVVQSDDAVDIAAACQRNIECRCRASGTFKQTVYRSGMRCVDGHTRGHDHTGHRIGNRLFQGSDVRDGIGFQYGGHRAALGISLQRVADAALGCALNLDGVLQRSDGGPRGIDSSGDRINSRIGCSQHITQVMNLRAGSRNVDAFVRRHSVQHRPHKIRVGQLGAEQGTCGQQLRYFGNQTDAVRLPHGLRRIRAKRRIGQVLQEHRSHVHQVGELQRYLLVGHCLSAFHVGSKGLCGGPQRVISAQRDGRCDARAKHSSFGPSLSAGNVKPGFIDDQSGDRVDHAVAGGRLIL